MGRRGFDEELKLNTMELHKETTQSRSRFSNRFNRPIISLERQSTDPDPDPDPEHGERAG
jgi:hypothetical protein